MNAKQLIKKIEENGWYFVRQSGSSHKVFQHPTIKGNIVIPDHGKKDLKIGTLNSILKQAGLK